MEGPIVPDLLIRAAVSGDLDTINAIYNHYVARSSCTFQTEPSTAAERAAWFAAHDEQHPVIVAERAGEILGWASLSRYHARHAYRFTVEDSVYIRHDAHGRGLGRALLSALIERATQLKHHTIIALIAADQPPSIHLHASLGFDQVAHLRDVGWKFDRWIDVIFMQRVLDTAGR